MINSTDKLILQIADDWSEEIFLDKRWNPDLGTEGCYAANKWLGFFLSCVSYDTYEKNKASVVADLQEATEVIKDWIIFAELKHKYYRSFPHNQLH